MYSVAVSTRLRTVSSRSSAISSALFSSCVRREISAAGRRDALNTAMTRQSSPALTISSTSVMPSRPRRTERMRFMRSLSLREPAEGDGLAGRGAGGHGLLSDPDAEGVQAGLRAVRGRRPEIIGRIVVAGGRSRPHLSLENDRVLAELLRFALCVRGEADRAVQRAEQQHEHHRRDQNLDHGFSPAVTQHLYQFFHSAAPPAGLLTGSYFL